MPRRQPYQTDSTPSGDQLALVSAVFHVPRAAFVSSPPSAAAILREGLNVVRSFAVCYVRFKLAGIRASPVRMALRKVSLELLVRMGLFVAGIPVW